MHIQRPTQRGVFLEQRREGPRDLGPCKVRHLAGLDMRTHRGAHTNTDTYVSMSVRVEPITYSKNVVGVVFGRGVVAMLLP